MSVTTEEPARATAIRPFEVRIPEAALDDLRRRIAATRWPERETVPDRSQGVQLTKLRALVEYWGTDYDAGITGASPKSTIRRASKASSLASRCAPAG